MGKVFASDSELKNVKVYAVIRMIHNYTTSHYVEPDSKHMDKELAGLICKDIKNYCKNHLIGISKFSK